MDKTLKDYIERTKKELKEDRAKSPTNNTDQYHVYPEQQKEEDRPINPYGQH